MQTTAAPVTMGPGDPLNTCLHLCLGLLLEVHGGQGHDHDGYNIEIAQAMLELLCNAKQSFESVIGANKGGYHWQPRSKWAAGGRNITRIDCFPLDAE